MRGHSTEITFNMERVFFDALSRERYGVACNFLIVGHGRRVTPVVSDSCSVSSLFMHVHEFWVFLFYF